MNELQKSFKGFSEAHFILVGKVTRTISIDRESDITYEINRAFKKTKYVEEFKKLFIKFLTLLTGKSKSWALRHKLSNDLTISSAVWKNVKKTKEILRRTLKKHLKDYVYWNKIAQDVFKKNLSVRKLPKYIDELVQAAKAMEIDSLNPEKFIDYKRKLKHLQRNAEKLSNVRLKKAYLALGRTTEGLSKVTLKKAVKRAVSARSKYFAERLVRTEMATAYNGTRLKTFHEEEIPAYKITLSTGHKIRDICDYHTKVDKYGLGQGVVPSRYDSHIPFHPNCMCSLTEVYTLRKKPVYDKDAGRKYVMKNMDLLLKRDQKRALKLKHPEKLIPHYQRETTV